MKKIGSLFLSVNTNSKIALLYYTFFTVRRLIMAVVVVIFSDSPILCIQIFIQLSLVSLTYIAYAKPFTDQV